MKQVGDHWEYIARYVDDAIVFSKDPMSVMRELEKSYVMKGVGEPRYYLGGDVNQLDEAWGKEGISTSLSADTYIKNVLPKLSKMCNMEQFAKSKVPMSEDYHSELDDTPFLGPEDHAKYRSFIGSANWLITLGRFDIAYATSNLARYSNAPRKGHFEATKKIFGYLRTFPQAALYLDMTTPPIRETAKFSNEAETWGEFYPDAGEDIPDDMPFPVRPTVSITCYVDADHVRDKLTRRSVTGIIILINNMPIVWVSKRQKTVETSTYGSELVAARIAVELMISMRYKLRMLGVNIEKESVMVGDNMSVILNTTVPSSQLKKKHQAICYHKVREAIASGYLKFGHISSLDNISDICTKLWDPHLFIGL